MRRIVVAIVLVAAVACWCWPFAGAYTLARAAASGDAAAIAAYVDRPALTRSVARQIVTAYLRKTGREARMRPGEKAFATSVGASIAAPYLDQLLASGALATLLDDGRIGQITMGGRTVVFDRTLPTLHGLDVGQAVAVVLHSSYDGVGSFRLSLPEPGSDERDYGLHFHLSGLTWRLSGIDLPADVVDRIVADVIAAEKPPG